MGFKNFLISIIKSLIAFLIVTIVFSTITLNLPNLMKNVFGDIFAYASPDAQKQAVSKLAETCSSLDKGEGIVTISQICSNRSLLDSMKENCRDYRELKRKGVKIENEAQVRETCMQVESGEIENSCSRLEGSTLPDFSNIGAVCKDYKAGLISDREFFFNVIGGALPANLDAPRIGALDKYNEVLNYLNKNKIIYFLILLALLAVLWLLVMSLELFLVILSQISFSLGVLIMLPYLGIIVYENLVGIDTTPILGSMFGSGAIFGFKAILSVILLMFLRTYSSFIVAFGIVFLAIGIAGRFYWFSSKKNVKSTELPKPEAKPKPGKRKKS